MREERQGVPSKESYEVQGVNNPFVHSHFMSSQNNPFVL